MKLATFQKLLSHYGQKVLQQACELHPQEADFLRYFTSLSRHHDPDLVRLALEIAILRQEASSKFPTAAGMYFSRQALEQASNFEISSYRAKRYQSYDYLVDLGCSVGGDTLAFAATIPTIGVDLDPLRLAMAQANLDALDLSANALLIQADLTAHLPIIISTHTACFFDPARRVDYRRIHSVLDYIPALNVIEKWLPNFPSLGVKISPGVKLEEVSLYNAEVEFISLRGDLKEAVLWFGPLKTTDRRATILPGPYSLSGEPDHQEFPKLSLSDPLTYLYEPDPAVIRAGLVQSLGLQLEATQLDPDIAYLSSDKIIESPFARVWKVEDWMPFGLKQLRAHLRQRGISQVVVKKRGSPLQPERLIHDLRLKRSIEMADNERVLFLTHLRGKPIVIVCFPRNTNG